MTSTFYRTGRIDDGALANGAVNDRLAQPTNLLYPLAGADEEWRFRRGRYSMVGAVNKGLLLPLTTVTPGNLPIFDNYGLRINSSGFAFQGLASQIDETVNETYVVVAKYNDPGLPVANENYAGTVTTTTTNGGDMIYRTAAAPTQINMLTRGYGNAAGTAFNSVIDCSAVPLGMRIVMVTSYSSTGRVFVIGNVGSDVKTGRSDRVLSTPARKRSVSNCWYSGYNRQTYYSYFAHIAATKTLAECIAIADYVRAMQARVYGNRVY